MSLHGALVQVMVCHLSGDKHYLVMFFDTRFINPLRRTLLVAPSDISWRPLPHYVVFGSLSEYVVWISPGSRSWRHVLPCNLMDWEAFLSYFTFIILKTSIMSPRILLYERVGKFSSLSLSHCPSSPESVVLLFFGQLIAVNYCFKYISTTSQNSGPGTDPWGMPEVTGIQREHSFPTTTCVLPVMKLSIHHIWSSAMQALP